MEAFKLLVMQNKILFLLLFVLIVVTIFLFIKANAAVKRNEANKEALIKKLDHLKMLRDNYSEITAESIKNDDSEYLMEGVASNIQLNIEKSEDLNAEFDKLNDNQKMIYALFYLVDEGIPSISNFFREFSEPLTPWAIKGAEMFATKEEMAVIKKMYDIFDEDNDAVSYFPDEVKSLDEKWSELVNDKELKFRAAAFIKENTDSFVNN